MEQTVLIVSVGELKESTFTTRQGEQKLLVKREFIISNGYDEIACEMLGDRARCGATQRWRPRCGEHTCRLGRSGRRAASSGTT